MTFSVLIPARLASTRLPNKPLADIGGRPMIVRVAESAARAGAMRVVVAADDASIVGACQLHGIQALLTRVDHASGSDRLAEACTLLGLDGDDVVVNVQGDEPLIEPSLIDAVAACLVERSACVMATAAHRIHSLSDFLNPNVVKVVLSANNDALYFSRAPLPWWRDGATTKASGDGTRWVEAALPAGPLMHQSMHQTQNHAHALRHVGIYAYRAAFLRRFPTMAVSPLEQLESLEQLRVLWHGERIAVHVSEMEPAAGVDTPHDLERVRRVFDERASLALIPKRCP